MYIRHMNRILHRLLLQASSPLADRPDKLPAAPARAAAPSPPHSALPGQHLLLPPILKTNEIPQLREMPVEVGHWLACDFD